MSRSSWLHGTPERNILEDTDVSDAAYQYVEQLLIEDDAEERKMCYDPLALQAMENSLYHVLVKSPSDSDGNNCDGSSDDSLGPVVEQRAQSSVSIPTTLRNANGLPNSSMDKSFAQPTFRKHKYIMQFLRGEEEAKKFLPPRMPVTRRNIYPNRSGGLVCSSLYCPLDSPSGGTEINNEMHPMWKDIGTEAAGETVKYGNERSASRTMGSGNHRGSAKGGLSEHQLWKDAAENELSMFERLFLNPYACDKTSICVDNRAYVYDVPEVLQHNIQHSGSGTTVAGKSPNRKRRSMTDFVDLWSLLIECGNALAADDKPNEEKLLKQIRMYSSPCGNAMQRLAYYCADALEARSVGIGPKLYSALNIKLFWPVNGLKAHRCLASVCPFWNTCSTFAVYNILQLAETANILHIVDFGIHTGFQWAVTIYNLSRRPGGPPKLRITGIEDPRQHYGEGTIFKNTGPRLANYCQRFNVPFEYNGILRNWEEIQLEDIRIDHKNEAVAVACLLRFEKLPDVVDGVHHSPRDVVLRLIRKMNPGIYIQSVFSGSYNVPTFFQRFRQAISHYSKFFEMLEATLPSENDDRKLIEKEILGRELLNVIACEGSDRVERVETHRQWQTRTRRAGFQQLPLGEEIVKILTEIVKARFHKDFKVVTDGAWVLQGWKGRNLCATTCWTPANRKKTDLNIHSRCSN